MDTIRLIASDMDATLLDAHSQLPPDFEAAVPALQEEIILIGDNGGAIRWKGETLFVSEMPAEGWHSLARLTKERGDIGMLCGLDRVYVEKPYQRYDAVFKNFYTQVEYVDDLLVVDAPADKFTIYLPRDNAHLMQYMVRPAADDFRWLWPGKTGWM